MNGSQPNYDIDDGDSRKRLDVENGAGAAKRSISADNVHFKILVPSIAAGAIIGKGGEAIGQIQKETGAKVKMSKTNDYYPGTTERVCLILGTVESITAVHNYIMDKILEKPDPNPRATSDGRLNVERHKQVKIMVPNSTAGMIIGKGGTYIKEIKEKTGTYVQISQKSKEINLPERCVTIAGDMDQNKAAVMMILSKIAEDPQSASCPNISYADVSGPVASAYPTGSPYALPPQVESGSMTGSMMTGGPTMGAMGGQSGMPQGSSANATATTVAMAASLNSSLNSSGGLTAVTLEGLRISLRNSGFGEEAVNDIIHAMCVLANYGFLNISTLGMMAASPGLTTPPTPVPMLHSPASSFNLGASGAGLLSAAHHHLMGPGPGGMQPSSQTDDYMQGQMYGGPQEGPPTGGAYAIFTPPPGMGSGMYGANLSPVYSPPTMQDDKQQMQAPMYKKDIEVPESLVGVILGPQGKSIIELQTVTSTMIQISKKGIYSPGTHNRVVTISGEPSSVNRAAALIGQQVQQEEQRRQQPPPAMVPIVPQQAVLTHGRPPPPAAMTVVYPQHQPMASPPQTYQVMVQTPPSAPAASSPVVQSGGSSRSPSTPSGLDQQTVITTEGQSTPPT